MAVLRHPPLASLAIRAGPRVLILCALALACCEQQADWDGVGQIEYSTEALTRRIRRRLDLLRAGVTLRDDLAVDQVWRNAAGYTFLAHRPAGGEAGIVAVRSRRDGIAVAGHPPGIGRKRLGICRVDADYWVVDVFSSLDEHLASAVAPRHMPGRSILRHLGLAQPVSADMDRLPMTPHEQVYWRELLPVVRANSGFGLLFVPQRRAPVADEEEAAADSLQVMGQRFDVEEAGEYLLVGQHRGGQVCRHVFAPGERYVTTVLHYDNVGFEPWRALRDLGLVPAGGQRQADP